MIRKFYDIVVVDGGGGGKRFDTGKLRYDLLQPDAVKGLVKVLSFGASKYEDRNWEKGMKWSRVIAPLKRHLAAIEAGEDYDIDKDCPDCQRSTPENWVCKNHSGNLHIDNLQCNAHFLSAYYHIYPQGDDRPHKYLNHPKIGLDIDEVLCNWLGAWRKKYDFKDAPHSWYFHRQLRDEFAKMTKNGELEKFYADLEPLIDPKELPFEPHCYITSRPCKIETTTEWLDKNGFPTKPVFCVGVDKSKVDVAKEAGIDIMVDDSYDNFIALNKAGICCFLYDQPHNRKYDVGYKRIKSLKELL